MKCSCCGNENIKPLVPNEGERFCIVSVRVNSRDGNDVNTSKPSKGILVNVSVCLDCGNLMFDVNH